ncbi:hypothetical protein SISNIDRAFT_449005 [Sistotremastrum niveocremeum HHB9708]|uniref:F-box domain-containing protein n=1 Tax=Sistotremastrum niveocremeum HHB9708 TaxID=1314777 RepID=A0A164Z304_9AGAM|nr:hypothetical protein SISNIDRAFT_449005 [Sistotremastrum niveocremeum HHB9708]
MGELDLATLIICSQLSTRMRQVISDPSLNPWRTPLSRILEAEVYPPELATLAVRQIVPRVNWIEILSLASPHFILFTTTLPNLRELEWKEAFERRFLPGWTKWKKEFKWKEAFLKTLTRVFHRLHSSCTAEEAWTKYIVLNRNGAANEQEVSSRHFNPLTIFNELKFQANLMHLRTSVRIVVQFADVRILALGVLHKPRGSFTINSNAKAFLQPPGITSSTTSYSTNPQPPRVPMSRYDTNGSTLSDISDYSDSPNPKNNRSRSPTREDYSPLMHPLPFRSHRNYPFLTPGGGDQRWLGDGDPERSGEYWVGGMMIVAQLVTPTLPSEDEQDLDLILPGPGRSQYASFTWNDLWAVAPWMKERITRCINGQGLGNE